MTLLAASNFKSKLGVEFLSIKEKEKLVDFLTRSQLSETHDLKPKNVDYGGWDLSGWMQEPRPSPGTNISISSFVLLAIQPSKDPEAKRAREKAKVWIKRVQNADHGFHFHPKKDHSGNKAEWSDSKFQIPRSYGSATIDGIRAMRALGLDTKAVSNSAAWITRNTDPKAGLTFVPGFEFDAQNRDASWGQGLLYYYLFGLALEKQHLPKSFLDKCQKDIPRFLIDAQMQNGSWENTSARMREDDPLIATPFAIVALTKFSSEKAER